MADQATLAFQLSARQRISAASERIVAALEFEPQGHPLQVQRFSKRVHKIPTVMRWHALRTITVNHEYRRVASSLVHVAQTDTPTTDNRYWMRRERALKNSVELRG